MVIHFKHRSVYLLIPKSSFRERKDSLSKEKRANAPRGPGTAQLTSVLVLVMILRKHKALHKEPALLEPWASTAPMGPSLLFITPLVFLPGLIATSGSSAGAEAE